MVYTNGVLQTAMKKLRVKTKITPFNTRVSLIGLALIAVVAVMLYGIRQHVSHPISGDEPHYLLMDYSLKVDGDLDLKNNYINQDYFRYYPAYTPNHVSPRNLEQEGGGWYSFHGMGLPVLLFPGFLINERTMPILMMVAVSILVLLLTAFWCFKLTKHRGFSVLTALTLACCYFFNGLVGYLYPDLLIAAMVLGLLIIVTFYFDKRWAQFLYGSLLGLMVIVHPKTLALVLPFVAVGLYVHYRNTKTIPWFIILGGLPFAALFFITLWRWYGTFNPASIYPTYLGVVSPLKSIPASLFDSQRGLLVYNPVLILIFSGVVIWWKRSKQTLLTTLIIIAPAYMVTMCFSEWWGGYSPTGRYLMNYLPALMPALTYLLISISKWYERALVVLLSAMTIMFTLAATYMKTPYSSGQPRSEFFAGIQDRIGIAFDKVLPHYTLKTELVGQFGIWKVLAGLVVVAVFVYFGYIIAQRSQNRVIAQTSGAKL